MTFSRKNIRFERGEGKQTLKTTPLAIRLWRNSNRLRKAGVIFYVLFFITKNALPLFRTRTDNLSFSTTQSFSRFTKVHFIFSFFLSLS